MSIEGLIRPMTYFKWLVKRKIIAFTPYKKERDTFSYDVSYVFLYDVLYYLLFRFMLITTISYYIDHKINCRYNKKNRRH